MKNILLILSVVFLFSSCSILQGGKEFKGKVTYKMDYEGEDLTPSQISQMPQTTQVTVLGNKEKSTTIFGMAEITNITNPDEDLFVQVIDAGDFGKFAVVKSLTEVENDSTNENPMEDWNSDIQFTEQTKEISGFTAKKIVVTLSKEGEDDKMFDAYYIPEIGGAEQNENSIYEGVEGMLVEFKQFQGPITINVKATEIEEGGVKEMDFLIPADAEQVTEEELKEKFGG